MTEQRPLREVGTAIRGRLGLIDLNRPEALNALNLAMVEQLGAVLERWSVDPTIDAVLIRSTGHRAFCAGGDVRAIGALPDPASRMAAGRAFFGAEYSVNHRINAFPKPFIALINGVAMGGGLGISVHGAYRVVSEDVRMAMPETSLGLFPDVGGTWFLNRCPGVIGRYLALVGPDIGAADALATGLATHYAPSASFEAVIAELSAAQRLDHSAIKSILRRHAAVPEGGVLAGRQAEIGRLFAGSNLDAVIGAIADAAPEADWIAAARSKLGRASPTSLRATWRRMTEAEGQSIDRVLKDDYRMAVRIVGGHDFAEGVRAILIDKDLSPRWNPASLAEVTEADVDALLTPVGDEWAPGGP